ncbi:MAG: tetratricopeptide repeat protein, partial [Agathobacter sp.]
MQNKSLVFAILTMLFAVGVACAQSQTSEGYAFQRAIEEYRNGETASAIEWFNKEIKDHPKNGYAYLYLATIHYEEDEYGKALTTINSAIANLPQKDKAMGAVALGYKGDIMLALCDTIRAIANYEQALKLNPENVQIYINRGNLYYSQANFTLSDKDFNRITELKPGETIGYLGLARNSIAQKDYENAISLLTYASRLDSENAKVYAFRAEAFLGQCKWTEAIEDLIKALSINGDAKAHYLMITIPDEALPTLKALLQIQANKETNEAAWYYYLGLLSQKKNRYREAIKYFAKANERDANSIFVERIADCYFDLGDYSQALIQVDKALAMKPDDEDLYLLKGNIYNEMGNYPAAIIQLGKYIEMTPEFYYGYYRRGWFRDEQGDIEGAIDDYTMAIILEPKYAYSYIGRGRD